MSGRKRKIPDNFVPPKWVNYNTDSELDGNSDSSAIVQPHNPEDIQGHAHVEITESRESRDEETVAQELHYDEDEELHSDKDEELHSDNEDLHYDADEEDLGDNPDIEIEEMEEPDTDNEISDIAHDRSDVSIADVTEDIGIQCHDHHEQYQDHHEDNIIAYGDDTDEEYFDAEEDLVEIIDSDESSDDNRGLVEETSISESDLDFSDSEVLMVILKILIY